MFQKKVLSLQQNNQNTNLMKKLFFIFVVLAAVGCVGKKTHEAQVTDSISQTVEQVLSPAKVGDVPLPDGFEREAIEDTTSFAYFLRSIPLKEQGTPVRTYDGEIASTTNSAYAVIDNYAPGKENLQQCADAVIRLRAEWLYKNARYDEIAFHFTNGWLCEYKRWAEGERVAVNGNKTSWYKATKTDYSYPTFRKYLDMVFTYAGTLSLSKELRPVHITDLQIGDVFIHGGSPGHAIIVVDMAKDIKEHTGDKCFLVAESYMPAQDIHILMNIVNEGMNPWYSTYSILRAGEDYNFATYFFNFKELRRFNN